MHSRNPYKPVVPLYERYKTLMAIKYIDEVVTYQTEDELTRLIEFYKNIRIMIKNQDETIPFRRAVDFCKEFLNNVFPENMDSFPF